MRKQRGKNVITVCQIISYHTLTAKLKSTYFISPFSNNPGYVTLKPLRRKVLRKARLTYDFEGWIYSWMEVAKSVADMGTGYS
ncbi:hypothetical protein NPIL_657241 [Nephila pilipes]|uniref:Uncharacterized protein n=1 Tax=Nephila pilipes TaxID=299642 RepID=A0A8X6UVD8_NEPPI|nr:hypothetical protein NPIL_657241 [Nephila pilipes]